MRAHEPGTDNSCSVTVFASGLACPEFVLPHRANTDPDIVECIIPVSNGDQLTVKGRVEAEILHGAIDLVADGSFLRDARIEGNSKGTVAVAKVWQDLPISHFFCGIDADFGVAQVQHRRSIRQHYTARLEEYLPIN